MHILHIIFGMGVGGAETMLVDIANAQVAAGHRVSLMIVNEVESPQVTAALSPDVRIIRLHRREGSGKLLMIMRLNAAIARLCPDIIHAHDPNVPVAVRLRRSRLIYTVHALNMSVRYCKGIPMAAITDVVAEDTRSRLPDADVRTILNGIRTDSILRRQSGEPQIFKLIQVGRIEPQYKGQDIAVRALGELKRRGVVNVELSFIGTGSGMDELKHLAEAEGVADRVHFDGLRERAYIYSNLCRYDAMIHPSRYEGFGLTVAEGMAAGLPLIVTEHDGPWEVADNGRLCISVEKDNPISCADAVETMMADYPMALARAAQGIEYVKRYDIARTVEAYDAMYSRLLR